MRQLVGAGTDRALAAQAGGAVALFGCLGAQQCAVAGRGALKNGVFVPTELGVSDAASMGRRRRREMDTSGSAAAPSGTAAPKTGAVPQ